MHAHKDICEGASDTGGEPPTKACLIQTARVSVFKDPWAPLREGHGNNIQAIVIQEKFVHFSNSHRRGFDFWATADLRGVLPQRRCLFKALYDPIVGGI